MKKRLEHAEEALRQIKMWRCETDQGSPPRNSFAQPMFAGANCEQSIAISFVKIMDNMHYIALAAAKCACQPVVIS
jgi:hypothetical protein